MFYAYQLHILCVKGNGHFHFQWMAWVAHMIDRIANYLHPYLMFHTEDILLTSTFRTTAVLGNQKYIAFNVNTDDN